MNTSSKLVAPALLAFMTMSASATDKTLEEMIVTGTRTPVPLSDLLATGHVLDQSAIARAQATDLPSLLGQVSGVDFRDSGGRGSLSSVFVRGTSMSQVVILIDGVRTASATTGATALSSIPLTSVERIEIVKGPLSGIYGADAMGGVIQVFTKRGSETFGGTVEASIGSYDSQQIGISLHGGVGDHTFAANINYESQDGFDRTDSKVDGNGDDDEFEETSGSLAANLVLTDRLTAQLGYLKSSKTVDFDNLFGIDEGRYSDSFIENFSGKLTYLASESLTLTFDASFFEDNSVTPAFTSDIATERTSGGIQADLSLSSGDILSAGFDYINDEVVGTTDHDGWDGTPVESYALDERSNSAAFLQYQYTGDGFSAIANLRYDDNEDYGDDINGSLSVGTALTDTIALSVSYGTAFQAPTFNDLYFPQWGNPDTKPQESESWEVSLKGVSNAISWRVSAYQTDIENQIVISGVGNTGTVTNVDVAEIEGIELEATTNVGEWVLSGHLDYSDARNGETNEFLDDRVLMSAALDMGRDFGDLYFGVNIQGEHGRHDRSGQSINGFVLLNVRLAYDVSENVKVFGRINNLFNEDYTLNLASSTASYETYGLNGSISVKYEF